ncbi:MAG: ECF transporter S component [Firmicutes bacterium]|nr:ECF transporter S component [Lachnospiraceae bacterium]MDD6066014.1 ECF transporter S component [Bacillota bacterium]MDY2820294.1 ECF transporter S component [Hominisplanchenecus sp.]
MSSGTKAVKTAERSNLRTMVQVGMLGAVSVVLMMFEIPLWFAPPFYKIDLSEIPVLIGTFAMGPTAGIFIELIKIVLHLLFKGTSTAGVGDFANFLIGCSMIVPAGIIYKVKKTRGGAVVGMITGTLFMAFVGCFLNAFVLLPAYGKAFGMSVDALIAMGTAVNPSINSLFTFVVLAVAPFNLLKGLIVGVITFLLYKHVSPILKGNSI